MLVSFTLKFGYSGCEKPIPEHLKKNHSLNLILIFLLFQAVFRKNKKKHIFLFWEKCT
ncbi:hypothetical protein D920_01532 [Enterococcus faecalis 13-SD-W-01]|nr:hypothetical protein D920_01532 [Enterococcus faecalis 13-SD-W-01]